MSKCFFAFSRVGGQARHQAKVQSIGGGWRAADSGYQGHTVAVCFLPDRPDRGQAALATGEGRGQRPDHRPLQAKGTTQLGLQLTQLDPAVMISVVEACSGTWLYSWRGLNMFCLALGHD